MKFIYVLTILLFHGYLIFGQDYTTSKIDSVLALPMTLDYAKEASLADKLYHESKKNNYEKGIFASLTKLANVYMGQRDFEKVIKVSQQIDDIPVKNSENYYYKVTSIINWSYAYDMLGFHDEGQSTLDRASSMIGLLNGDNYIRAKGRIYEAQASIYVETKKPERLILDNLLLASIVYSKLESKKYRKSKLQSLYCNISTSYTELNMADSAIYYLHKAINLNLPVSMIDSHIYGRLAQYHFDKNHLDSALIYFEKTEKLTEDPAVLKLTLLHLSKLYEKKGDKDKALKYNRKYAYLLDSLSSQERRGSMKALETIRQDIQNANESSKQIYYVVIGLVICISFGLGWYFIKFYAQYKNERKERLNSEKLVLKKDQQLIEVIDRVSENFDEILELAKQNDPAFFCRFQECYPEFCDAILKRYPDIVKSEFVFCAYLKLNFSTKEIATYTFVTPKAVQNRKNRIRKKLNIPSDDDIYIWMNTLNSDEKMY